MGNNVANCIILHRAVENKLVYSQQVLQDTFLLSTEYYTQLILRLWKSSFFLVDGYIIELAVILGKVL